tara:strand:+ start:2421 stop:2696 length:276 start_codon:yes stop_codon:yes gene_type:complete
MLTYKTTNGQNIFDVALQTYGNIQSVVRLLIDNPELSINEEIPIGFELKYDDQVNEFKTFAFRKKITVATNDGLTQSGKAFDISFDNNEFK